MRAVVQRVSSATVDVDGVRIAAIGTGVAVLLGVTHDDDTATAAAMARKIHGLRILEGERSVSDTLAEVLVVSQFTLYGDTRKGRRPSWSAAAAGAHAEPLVAQVVADLRGLGAEVATGRFGAKMSVGIVNEGPMTVLLEL